MKTRLLSLPVVLPLVSLPVLACASNQGETPTLVVYVVVDQLRGDLLERYDSLFTGGFRRLLDDGFRFTHATHDHAETATAVGHATLSTGVFPSRHGIVGNSWLERTPEGWRSVLAVEDTTALILGRPALVGRSPANLRRGGLANWIVARDSSAIVVSVSRKDRAAITMAGTARGHVYWIPEGEGRFVTSSFYAQDYPGWVEQFNAQQMPRIFGDSVWEQTVPSSARRMTRPDTASYEGDGIHTFFPHRFRDESAAPDRSGALNRWAYYQPFPDAAVAAIAREAILSLEMGRDDITDYLGLSFSQTDAVGHDYGPLSREQLENLLHLDKALGDLLDALDENVGWGRWVLALTADHGVLEIPEYLAEGGHQGRRATREDLAQLRAVFTEYREKTGDSLEKAEDLVVELERFPFIADALTLPELTSGPPADSFVVLMRNSYYPDRWIGGYGSQESGVVFRFPEAYYPTSEPRGTGHGTPYYYDRWVPLVFLGAGVEPGTSTTPVRTVDIAPTLADLAGVAFPDDLDGQPLFR